MERTYTVRQIGARYVVTVTAYREMSFSTWRDIMNCSYRSESNEAGKSVSYYVLDQNRLCELEQVLQGALWRKVPTSHLDTIKECHRQLSEILGAIDNGTITASSGLQAEVNDSVTKLWNLINDPGVFW